MSAASCPARRRRSGDEETSAAYPDPGAAALTLAPMGTHGRPLRGRVPRSTRRQHQERMETCARPGGHRPLHETRPAPQLDNVVHASRRRPLRGRPVTSASAWTRLNVCTRTTIPTTCAARLKRRAAVAGRAQFRHSLDGPKRPETVRTLRRINHLGRASGAEPSSGGRGRRFKSSHPDHWKIALCARPPAQAADCGQLPFHLADNRPLSANRFFTSERTSSGVRSLIPLSTPSRIAAICVLASLQATA